MTTPATTTQSRSRSRRALLVGALGGLGAWAASAVGRASSVRAENEYIQVGHEYITAQSRTRLRNQANDADVLVVEAHDAGVALLATTHSGMGVWGNCTSGVGVHGNASSGIGLSGSSSTGIALQGVSGSNDKPAAVGVSGGNGTGLMGHSHSGISLLPNAKPKTGVYGHATQDSGSRGVWGRSNAGQGVRGQATSGVGLYGTATSGFALRTSGRLIADKVSGVANIPAGSTGVTIDPGVNVTSGSFVLLTPRHNIGSRGLWYVPNVTASTFRIRMSSARSSSTKVAWLLIG